MTRALRKIRLLFARLDCAIIGHNWWPEFERWSPIESAASDALPADPIARCVHCNAISGAPTRYFRITVGK